MKQIPSKVYNYLHSIQKIQYNSKNIIIEADNKKYICKDPLEKEVKEYLDSIDDHSFYKKINIEEEFDLCEIIEETEYNCLLEFFQKSKIIDNYSMGEQDNIYHKMDNLFAKTFNDFFHLQDLIEEQLYPTSLNYNLLINFSLIYHLLSLGNYFLEEWNNAKPTKYTSIIWIDNISKKNILYNKIIDIESLKRDNIIFALANYYQEYYQKPEITEEIEKIDIPYEEKQLYYALISIPSKNIVFPKEIDKLLIYVKKTHDYLLEKYKENQKAKEDMFKQQQKDIKFSSNENQ